MFADDGAPRILLKINRAALRLDCSRRQIYALVKHRELELVHQGRASYVTAVSLNRYVDRLRRKAAAGR